MIGALLVGGMVWLSGRFITAAAPVDGWISGPTLFMPVFSWQAMLELVVPLAITVLVVQNGRRLCTPCDLKLVNAVTVACGAWSMLAALVGTVSTCLTGPTNALISSSGRRESHYAAGIVVGVLAVVFGLFAPAFTSLMLATPPTFIATLAGLAMLKVLQAAFVTAFATASRSAR
ncbi:MAG: benzoate/H(+) symporter BenE family transporter [Burkholderiaceae bacterium]